jgi:hypothetical protein
MRSYTTPFAAISRYAWALFGGLVVLLLSTMTAHAAPAGISQSYNTPSTNIAQGALLSLTSKSGSSVEPATTDNITRLVGVAADKPLVELSKGDSSSVSVVVSGSTKALVTDLNGGVKTGDKITISPISGIGMKASDATEIIGTAQADFSSITTTGQKVAGQNGDETVHVGLLPIAVNVAYYSASASKGALSSFVPPFMQSLANSLAGKQVSPLRVLIGAIALLLGFITVISMLYASIRSGVTSIGRNPLAERALRKGLVDVVIAAIGLLIVTAVIVYIVLLA